MGMKSWNISGYGFPLFVGENEPTVIQFIIDRIDSYAAVASESVADAVRSRLEEILVRYKDEDGYDCEGMRNALDETFDFNTASAVAGIISVETGLSGFEGYQADADCCTEESVLYVRSFPWEMSPEEISLSKEKLDGLCRSMCACLGVPEDKVGEQDLEYYG